MGAASPSRSAKAERLCALLRERSFARKRVVLARARSATSSSTASRPVLTAEGHVLVGELMLDALAGLPACDAIAVSSWAGVRWRARSR